MAWAWDGGNCIRFCKYEETKGEGVLADGQGFHADSLRSGNEWLATGDDAQLRVVITLATGRCGRLTIEN